VRLQTKKKESAILSSILDTGKHVLCNENLFWDCFFFKR
jgi:hypothetical protein